MHAALLLALIAPQGFDFFAHGPYDPAVPRPDQLLGYLPGERHTRFDQQEAVIQSLAAAAPARVRLFRYGSSVEGRPLRILAISSPENIARLDEVRERVRRLAAGEAADPGSLAATPAIVWINQCIHGNEPASFESGMLLAYTLAASRHPKIEAALRDCVVVVNPAYNPDGHERFVTWYASVAQGSADPDAFEQSEPAIVRGRFNHYRFDLNRDRVAMSQAETRQEAAEFLRWNPQAYVDQHGQVNTYFFPPAAMSVNANVDRARYERWTDLFGRATARAFDAHGFGYYIRDIFDLYYPGYLDSWSSLSGAIGMTHETDGPRSRVVERSDGSLSTLKGAVAKHLTAALAVIGAAAENREALLRSFAEYKRRAASGEHAGKHRYVVVKGRREALARLQRQLQASGIRAHGLARDVALRQGLSVRGEGLQDATVPAGEGLAIPMAQPQGPLAKALFENVSDFEPEFAKEQERRRKQAASGERYPAPEWPEFYDLTAWNVALAHDLQGWWVESVPADALGPAAWPPTAGSFGSSAVGWAIPPGEEASLLAFRLLDEGVRVQVSTRDMAVGGERLPAGTFLVLADRNPGGALEARVREASAAFHARVVPLGTSYPDAGRYGPGSETVVSVRKPRVAVVFGDDQRVTDFGSVWFLFAEQLKLPFTPLHAGALERDLSRFTCIVFPEGRYGPPSEELRRWISRGGCAVLLGGGEWAMGDKGLFKLEPVRLDQGRTPGSVPGSIFRAELDARSFLSYGYGPAANGKIDLPVPVEGSRFYKAKPEGGGAVAFSKDPKTVKLLSGWSWPGETEKALQGVVWLHDEPVGQGRVVWFAQDPTSRAMWPGLNRLLLNAVLLGPAG